MTTVALVPALRRADRVGATVSGLSALVDHVVVVDDGSDDGGATADAARRAGATVVVLPANRGKGGAFAAGIAVTPYADTYLLVDADTAATGAGTAPLLRAVEDGADLAIGVLPPAGGRGGFGAVRHVAGRGIRRACGFEAAAPLSGQRAVRAPLLRSLELADRFGVEVGMTIDAVRAGARVVEVPVEVDHAHTGRGVAGFSHRAGQGWDLLRALWPRLVSEPARTALLVAATILVVAALTASAAAAVPRGTPLGPADQVVLVAVRPQLRLEDLSDPARPELASLAGERGAIAAANVDIPDHSSWSTWATVGAGDEVRARPPSREPDASNPFLVQDIEEGQGRLGDALRRAGRTTAFVGTQPTSPVRLVVADGAGLVDRAATAGSLGVQGMVNRSQADITAGADMVAIDATEVDPAGLEELLAGLRPRGEERRLLLLVTPADPARRFRLRPLVASGPGAPAGRLMSPSTRRDGLVVLTDVAPTILGALGVPVPDDMVGRPLRRLAKPADVAGLLEADRLSRQRSSVWDPALVVVVPLHLAVYAWAWRGHRRSRRALPDAHRHGADQRSDSPVERVDESAVVPAALVGSRLEEVVAGGGGAPPGAERARGGGSVGQAIGNDRSSLPATADGPPPWGRRSSRPLMLLSLALVAWPLATFVVRAVPGTGSWDRWAGALAVAVDALIVAVAWRAGRRRGLAPLALVLGGTLALVTLDLGVGGPLQLSSAYGGAAHSGGRFFGLGNAAFAVYAAAALVALSCARRRAPWMVGLLLLVALTDALPQLGGDVGGAVTLAPIFALTVAALWGRLSWRTVVVALVAAAAVVGAALAFDLSRPDDARTHLARYVAGGGRSSSIGGKLAQNLGTYAALPILVPVVIIAAVFAVLLWRGRFRAGLPPGTPARIGVAAAVATALLGNVLNDSGPIVTLLVMSIVCPFLVIRAAAEEPPPRVLAPLPP